MSLNKTITDYVFETKEILEREGNLNEIGKRLYNVKISEYISVNIKKLTLYQTKEVALKFTKNKKAVDKFKEIFVSDAETEISVRDIINSVVEIFFEQTKLTADLLNIFLGEHKTFDDYANEYTLDELEKLVVVILAINIDSFVGKKLLSTLEGILNKITPMVTDLNYLLNLLENLNKNISKQKIK